MTSVSIIIPCYNASSKIGRCFSSLRDIDFPRSEFEVIFIDDKSSDGTYEIIVEECQLENHWVVHRLNNNSGSPSRPRNEGIKKAKGEYVFYLDCDDEILPDTLKKHYEHARHTGADVVRGSLLADNGKRRILMNAIPDWKSTLSKKERVEKIMAKQSTTITQLIKKSLILENKIEWPEKIKMGEDTVFLVDVLVKAKNIEYLSHETFVYNKMPFILLSSTQSYGKKELLDHIYVWSYVQDKLLSIGVDYSKSRLSVGLQAALKSLIYKNKYDIDFEAFLALKKFVKQHIDTIKNYNLNTRFTEILNTVIAGDFDNFIKLCRPRMLVAGHDLKFMQPAELELSKYFELRYDKWDSHTAHDEGKSKKLLEWAEVIWCEWMLGNSIWYSQHKRNDQKLIFRMHRQELATNYAESINFEKVDLVIVVSTLFFERLLERFPNIPRNKVRLIPNYIDVDEYKKDWHPDRLFTLAMIGILPSKKNLHIGLEILKELRKIDARYKLLIYSKKPKDLPWLARNKEEMAYFDECEQYIKKYNLNSCVVFKGHCDLKQVLAEHKVGYVLSLSESVIELPGFESFHLAIADGFASGGVGLIKKWAGCEYVYQSHIIKNDVDQLVSSIASLSLNESEYKKLSLLGLEFIRNEYSLQEFASSVKNEIAMA